jgi:hypothetical protein
VCVCVFLLPLESGTTQAVVACDTEIRGTTPKLINQWVTKYTGHQVLIILTRAAQAELVQVHCPIPAPQKRVRDNPDSHIWAGSILFGYR